MPALFQHKHAELREKYSAKTTTSLKIKIQSSETVRTIPRQALYCTKKERELKPQSNSKSEENFERKNHDTVCLLNL